MLRSIVSSKRPLLKILSGKQGCADAYCAASVLTDDTKETLEQFMKKVEEQDGQAVKVWKEYLNNLAILISNLRMAYDMDNENSFDR